MLFTRDMSFFRRIFAPRGPRGIPTELHTTVQPVVDAFGTSRLENVEYLATIGGLATIQAWMSVPANVVRVILAVHGLHDDVTARTLHFYMSRTNVFQPVRINTNPAPTASAQSALATPTLLPIVVPPAHDFGIITTAIAAGARLYFNAMYVDLPVGEYLRLG